MGWWVGGLTQIQIIQISQEWEKKKKIIIEI